MVVVAEADAQLAGDGPLLDPADKNVDLFFGEETGQLQRVGVVNDDGAGVGDRLQFLVLFPGAGLRADHDHLHVEQAEGLDERKSLERTAHVDGRLPAGQGLAVRFQGHGQLFHLRLDDRFRALHDCRILEEAGDVVERLGHVLDAEVGNAQRRDTVFFLHHVGQPHGRAGALDHVQGRAVGAPDVGHPAVAGDVGHHLDAHLPVVVADHPDLAGQVEVAEDIERILGDSSGVAGADEAKEGVTGGLVAGPLVALEPFGLDRDHRDAVLGLDLPADRLQVVADDADDAGRVDKGRLGCMPFDQLAQGGEQLLLAAEDDVTLLQVGGEGQPVQFRAGRQRAADVPGVDRAADGPVHQVDRIGDRVEHHPRAAEHAGPLADRAGQAVLVADDGKGGFALDHDLTFPFLQCCCVHGSLLVGVGVFGLSSSRCAPEPALNFFLFFHIVILLQTGRPRGGGAVFVEGRTEMHSGRTKMSTHRSAPDHGAAQRSARCLPCPPAQRHSPVPLAQWRPGRDKASWNRAGALAHEKSPER